MQCQKIDVEEDARLEPEKLISQMKNDLQEGLIPAFVVVTLGTTGLCAFDDLNGVALAVRSRFPERVVPELLPITYWIDFKKTKQRVRETRKPNNLDSCRRCLWWTNLLDSRKT